MECHRRSLEEFFIWYIFVFRVGLKNTISIHVVRWLISRCASCSSMDLSLINTCGRCKSFRIKIKAHELGFVNGIGHAVLIGQFLGIPTFSRRPLSRLKVALVFQDQQIFFLFGGIKLVYTLLFFFCRSIECSSKTSQCWAKPTQSSGSTGLFSSLYKSVRKIQSLVSFALI